jgi:hypothetical protein
MDELSDGIGADRAGFGEYMAIDVGKIGAKESDRDIEAVKDVSSI